ncbi:MAG: AAC(3) family N-acetyltransferase [Alphaproteobacteria bacterium]|jgi:hypothetical protein|nr:AAC(3) family N-acetyltransferase [Alphaproteobacteria bacterium]
MFIFGWGFKTIKRYGVLGKGTCNVCNKDTRWQLIKITTWFTLFFIPIIPTSIKRMVICDICNSGKELDKATFNKIKDGLNSNDSTREKNYDPSEVTKYVSKTETQMNYLKEMEEIRKEKEKKEKSEKNKVRTKEELAILKSENPYTKEILANEFRKLGIKKGMTLLLHSSLSSIGWVCGKELAVIDALMDVLTEEGTLVMPAHSGEYSDPTYWGNPPVPKEWLQTIKDNMPAFDINNSRTKGIGIIPETFRNYNNVVRSNHPQVSFSRALKKSY